MIELLLNFGVLITLMALLLRTTIVLIPSPMVQRCLTAIVRGVTKRLARAARVLGIWLARKGYQWSLAAVEWLAQRWNDHWQP